MRFWPTLNISERYVYLTHKVKGHARRMFKRQVLSWIYISVRYNHFVVFAV